MDQKEEEIKIDNQEIESDGFVVKKLEMRSIPKREFEKYLSMQATRVEEDVYFGNGWQVTLSEERQENICGYNFVAVDVTLAAKQEIFEAFLLTFRKNFMRGGG